MVTVTTTFGAAAAAAGDAPHGLFATLGSPSEQPVQEGSLSWNEYTEYQLYTQCVRWATTALYREVHMIGSLAHTALLHRP